MNTEQLGERIVSVRKQNGMSQKELAQRLQVSVSALCKWEHGQNCPDIITIKKIADVFQVSCDSLLGEEAFIVQASEECPQTLSGESGQKIKGRKAAVAICAILICIVSLLAFLIYQRSRFPYKIVDGRYAVDDTWGDVYELSVVCPKEIPNEQVCDYVEQLQIQWENGELSVGEAPVLKLSFYDKKKQALRWEATDDVAYIFRTDE